MELKNIEDAFADRKPYLAQWQEEGTNCFQLFSGEREGIPNLLVEKWGDFLVLNIYDNDLFEEEVALKQVVSFFQSELKITSAIARNFISDRSHEKFEASKYLKFLLGDDSILSFPILENNISFLARLDRGFSLGLFLDQRENRKSLAGMDIPVPKVLNLFAYSCGFSVYQAKKDRITTNIDISPMALNWGKENFLLNGLSAEGHFFYRQDSLSFLKRARKRNEQYGLVIIDPPSFSRSKDGVFQIEKDLGNLLSSAYEVVVPGGYLFFSSNFQKWQKGFPSDKINKLISGNFQRVAGVTTSTDFEKTQNPIDCFLIRKGA